MSYEQHRQTNRQRGSWSVSDERQLQTRSRCISIEAPAAASVTALSHHNRHPTQPLTPLTRTPQHTHTLTHSLSHPLTHSLTQPFCNPPLLAATSSHKLFHFTLHLPVLPHSLISTALHRVPSFPPLLFTSFVLPPHPFLFPPVLLSPPPPPPPCSFPSVPYGPRWPGSSLSL